MPTWIVLAPASGIEVFTKIAYLITSEKLSIDYKGYQCNAAQNTADDEPPVEGRAW